MKMERNLKKFLARNTKIANEFIDCIRGHGPLLRLAVQKPQSVDRLSRNNDLKTWQVAEFGKDIVDILMQVG